MFMQTFSTQFGAEKKNDKKEFGKNDILFFYRKIDDGKKRENIQGYYYLS